MGLLDSLKSLFFGGETPPPPARRLDAGVKSCYPLRSKGCPSRSRAGSPCKRRMLFFRQWGLHTLSGRWTRSARQILRPSLARQDDATSSSCQSKGDCISCTRRTRTRGLMRHSRADGYVPGLPPRALSTGLARAQGGHGPERLVQAGPLVRNAHGVHEMWDDRS
jgi:hypothetical protein